MPLDGARAEEQLCSDLVVGEAVAREPGDLALLRGQLVARLDRPLSHLLARHAKLVAGALGERLHSDRREALVRAAQLLARVDAPALAAQPFAVQQARTRELGTEPRAAEMLDRGSIQLLRVARSRHQRASARLDAGDPVGATGARHLAEPRERLAGRLRLAAARRRLDELAELP